MKKFVVGVWALVLVQGLGAQEVLSLDVCRKKALDSNKRIQVAQENVRAARALKKAAFAQFLPSISATGTYLWNEKNVSLLQEDAYLPVYATKADGSLDFAGSVNNVWVPVGEGYVPVDASGKPFDPTKNPEKIQWKNYALLPKESMEFDAEHVFAGTIGFTQPIYMGGKIRALYRMAQSGEALAEAQREQETTELLLEVDEAYWRVVSLENKWKLADQFRQLMERMQSDVDLLMEAGLATKSDGLKVRVKRNEVDVLVSKAENGLSLSRMALNQLCGMPLDTVYVLEDALLQELPGDPELIPMEDALSNRPEMKALAQVEALAQANRKLMQSRMLPTIGLTGNYLLSNPNVYNGYSNTFGGMFNVGVVAHVPLFHFGDRIHTLRAAESKCRVAALEREEVGEKIQLQINQRIYQMVESRKKLLAAQKHVEQAEENVLCAEEGFREGVIRLTDYIGAQTAWLSAKSEDIDARIDLCLNQLYVMKSQGINPVNTVVK